MVLKLNRLVKPGIALNLGCKHATTNTIIFYHYQPMGRKTRPNN
jgi:hypothetical protein